jgi:Mlc titration factor MtfA (ptsG expression regulator)
MDELLVVLATLAIPVVIVLVWFGRIQWGRRRRAKLRQQPAPALVIETLEQRVGIYSQLPDELKAQLHGHINVFLDEKRFLGLGGLEITDEMCIIVAGLACVLLLNRDATYYPGFSSILLYPKAYVSTDVRYDGEVEVRREMTRAGESWHRGPVVLSWDDVMQGAANVGDGYNVVLHEFAHKLDEENDGTNGLPILTEQSHYDEWAAVLGREYKSLETRVSRGKNRVLDEYALTSPPEFFAVATESFFEKSRAMQERLPDLYEQLRNFYRVDPATWGRR